jgi:hypothetical protein
MPKHDADHTQIPASMRSIGNCEDAVEDRGELHRVDFTDEMNGRASSLQANLRSPCC